MGKQGGSEDRPPLSTALYRSKSYSPKDKVGSTHHAKRSPNIIRFHRTPHDEHRKRDENQERHPNLKDLELSEREFGVANAVCRNVNRIFKKSDPPTSEGLLVGMTPFSQNYGLGQQRLWVAIRLTMSPIRLIVNLYKVDSNSLEILQLW